MSAARKRPTCSRIVRSAARSTPNLIALGTSLATGLLLGNLWLVIAGGWLYLLLVARNSTSPRFWRRLAEAEADWSRQLPPEATLTDPSLMLILRAIRQGYGEVARVMKEVPDAEKSQLAPAVSSLDHLCLQAAQLIRDADALSRYLLTGPREATEREIEKLNHEIARASDQGGKREYMDALSAREDQLASVNQVALEHERIVAALHFIVGTVEGLPAWIYRMRALDARAKEDRVTDTCEELTRMKAELAGSVHLLEGLARSAGPCLESDGVDTRLERAR